MGRLTLNVLLSFAQFEREVTGERIRDQIAASKKKGMWMGGAAPVGYSIGNRPLVTNDDEASLVQMIFERYMDLGTVKALKQELDEGETLSPKRLTQKGRVIGGKRFSRGALHALLKNPVYIGKIKHKEEIYEGLHDGIIQDELWHAVQSRLRNQANEITRRTERNYMLQGLLFDADNVKYSPTYTRNTKGVQIRYYVSQNLLQYKDHPKHLFSRILAVEIEKLVERSIGFNMRKIYPIDSGCGVRDHFLNHQSKIRTHEFVRAVVGKIMVGVGEIEIQLKDGGIEALAKKHFDVVISTNDLDLSPLTVPYQTKRARSGAIVIQPENSIKDPLDLQEEDLIKLAKGLIWRGEHFDGMALKDIAKRENCSEAYVGTAIFKSFDILMNTR